ncbi:unnamed protein product (macronuclear) [Paramecium tetraurelia]|uniref:Uncharacterized protein n=1 Tax=Paramecium tetraurelia TaxID=5888 RepID=A0E8T3_PARTE|nr:uncharacterized protein GSPATT00024430001 [Paramecium tetraurelia]CAK91700.1 unnamed protein product [Paramecium tetraurelia]|eukprot:XP_001459097.1 hypothetical protein (macronuclear) [Paramecium tetraurelia strain d4-2]
MTRKYDLQSLTQEQIMKIKSLDLTQGKRSAVKRIFRGAKDKSAQIQEQKNQTGKKYW